MAQGLPPAAGERALSARRVLAPAGALRAAVAAAALAYPLLYAAVALLRMRYPYELEWLEGGSLDQVQRILSGQPVYARPTLEYVAFPYAPLFYYVAALPAALFGAGFGALRLVSFLASLGSLAAIASIVRRETGRVLPALVAAGIFAGTYRAAGAWLDVGRVDSLFLALLLWAAQRVRFGTGARSQAGAGALLGLAFLTKQVAVVALLGFALHHLLWRRRDAAPLIGTAALGIIAGTLLMDWTTGGWYTWYAFRPHGLLWHRFITFWWRDLAPVLPIALAAALLVALVRDEAGLRPRFYAVFAAVMLGTGLFSRMIVGAYLNALLPAYAGLAVLAGIGFDAAWRLLPAGPPQRGRAEAALLGSALLQLVMLAWNPLACLPKPADRDAGGRLTRRLGTLGDAVLVPSHPYLAARATGHRHAHAMAVGDILYFAPRAPEAAELEAALREALCGRRFSAVVTDGHWRYQDELDRYYGAGQPLAEVGSAFYPLTGAPTRPQMLYVRPAPSPSVAAAECRPPASAPARTF